MAAATAAQPQWRVCAADGQQYGPVSKAELDSWVAQGRLDERCQVYCDGWPQWKWAHEVYPELQKPAQPTGAGDALTALLGGTPGAAGAAPATVNPFQAPVTVGSGPITRPATFDTGWYAVRAAFKVTQAACIVGAACAVLLMLSTLAGFNLGVPGLRTRGAQQAVGLLASLSLWAMWGYLVSLIIVLTCELVALAVPRTSGSAGMLIGSLSAYAIALSIAFVLTVLLLPALVINPVLATVGMLLVLAALFVGAAMYGLFIGRAAGIFGDPWSGLLSIIYLAVVGILFVWILLLMFAISPTSQTVGSLLMVVSFALVAAERVLLMLLGMRGVAALTRVRRPAR